ncbi:carboxymuconolactone decarboxylase family protein [Pseudomonas sp. BJa5]|uniref:carboxymuconolactone decarboxylase family protein n=1 Tax=Pseudomonas sp. BJa5 TaxID=2936270 RepID=UPI0025596B31|nr:carboxymuconolactone decarboxylase family protein [Pseudomonas sp. BGr12]MDL2423331.1 carboxymuconolactone decarboxylase family protein [Pseudomonas sp. BGr12]
MSDTPNYNALRAAGLVDESLDRMAEWDAPWTETFMKLVEDSQVNDVLDPKLVALIRLNIDVTATHLYAPGVRRHVRDALRLGATRAEILEVFKLASVVGIHACALGVPILAEEMANAGIADLPVAAGATPVCDAVRANGMFNPLWDKLYQWDPAYLEKFLAMGFGLWKDGILPPLWIEFLCIAGDAAITHLYGHGTRRHIQAALQLGASREQVLEVLKIVSLQGIEACELGVPMLDEELRAFCAAQ